MDENVGKIYCLDRGNENALLKQTQRLLNAYRGNGCGESNGITF